MKTFVLALFFTIIIIGGANAQSTLTLQEKCTEGAMKYFFEGLGKLPKEDEDGNWHGHYDSHYSRKLDKCFILFVTTFFPKDGDKPVLWFEDLYDVFEGKHHGFLFRTQYKDVNRPVKECKVGDKICHSSPEFKALIKPYMEE